MAFGRWSSSFVAVGLILRAHELERVGQRGDRRFERAFDVAATQAHLADVAIDLGEPALRLLQIRSARLSAS